MVERPIKKSERQTTAEPSSSELETKYSTVEGDDSITETSEKRVITTPSSQSLNKSKGRDKRNQKEDERSKPMNLALMRGPKPKKFVPPTIKETQESITESSAIDSSQTSTAED